jgi:hypothetical protein
LLSHLDTNRFSPTYGCFDRAYWHYKVIDFPSATYQQGVLALALLYKEPLAGNIYHRSPRLIDLASAGLLFWTGIQNGDGSFNEWFPNEHSHVATAFTAYAISEALLLLGGNIPSQVGAIVTGSLAKAGAWLDSHIDEVVLNHTAGAIAALHNIYLVTGDKAFLRSTDKNIETLLKYQSDEGWFPEYYGADPGYLSVSVDYLAKYYRKSQDERIRRPLEKALEFMTCFVHPDGTYGGEHGARNTKYLFPHGLEILAADLPDARYILGDFYRSLDSGQALNLYGVDDRYFIFFFFGNYVQAMLECKSRGDGPLLAEGEREAIRKRSAAKTFAGAGLVVRRTPSYYLVCGCKKNGVIRLYDWRGGQLIFGDAGYFGELADGSIVSSQALSPAGQKVEVKTEGTTTIIQIESPLVYVNVQHPLRRLLVPFRLFNYTVGRSSKLSRLFDRWVKRKMIVENKTAAFNLAREIVIKESEVEIADRIWSAGNNRCRRFGIEETSTTLHVPSSRYFQPPELAPLVTFAPYEFSECLNAAGVCQFNRRISFAQDGLLSLRFAINGTPVREETIELPSL